MEPSDTPNPAERLHAIHLQTMALVEQLQALTSEVPPDRLPWLLELIGQAQELMNFAAMEPAPADKKNTPPTPKQLQAFGKLLRDKRNAAGFSRMQLARRAKLSDATIKFIETARHPPSRATLIRLIGVEDLKLSWGDAPGAYSPPAAERALLAKGPQVHSELNCLLTPTYDPVRMVMELGRFLETYPTIPPR